MTIQAHQSLTLLVTPTCSHQTEHFNGSPIQAKIVEYENEINRLVEQNRVIEARQLLSQAIETGVSSAILKNWQIVLEKPKVSVKEYATGILMNANHQWRKKNAKFFNGLWVALQKGVLIESHENLLALRRTLKKSGKLTEDIVFMNIKTEEQ